MMTFLPSPQIRKPRKSHLKRSGLPWQELFRGNFSRVFARYRADAQWDATMGFFSSPQLLRDQSYSACRQYERTRAALDARGLLPPHDEYFPSVLSIGIGDTCYKTRTCTSVAVRGRQSSCVALH